MAILVKGYRVVPQSLADGHGRGFRHVHLKEHRGTFKPSGPSRSGENGEEVAFAKGTVLFVGNVDDQGGRLCRKTIEERLRRALSSCGDVVHVHVSAAETDAGVDGTSITTAAPAVTGKKAPGAARFAHVCFSSAAGVRRALALEELPSGALIGSAAEAERVAPEAAASDGGGEENGAAYQDGECRDENGDETCGYAALIQRHRRKLPPYRALQAEVDSCMERFEMEEAEEAARRKALLDRPEDEDGFVTVAYKRKRGRHNGGGGDGGRGGDAAAGGPKKKRKGAGELADFYRFQMRETRREQLAALRSKFEQDKARVAKMKAQRKFRPF